MDFLYRPCVEAYAKQEARATSRREILVRNPVFFLQIIARRVLPAALRRRLLTGAVTSRLPTRGSRMKLLLPGQSIARRLQLGVGLAAGWCSACRCGSIPAPVARNWCG